MILSDFTKTFDDFDSFLNENKKTDEEPKSKNKPNWTYGKEKIKQRDTNLLAASNTTYNAHSVIMKVFKKDAVGNRILTDEIKYRAYVFPLTYPKVGTSFMTDIAGFVLEESSGDFNCKATTLSGKKTLVITIGTHGLILKGHWSKGQFLSSAFVMNSSSEDLEVIANVKSNHSNDLKNPLGHEVKTVSGQEYHILPLREENKLMTCLLMDNNETIVVCGDNKVEVGQHIFSYDPHTDKVNIDK